MPRLMQRTIQIADFELPRGPITVEQLLAMPHETWDHIRLEINRRRQKQPDQPLARCRLCNGSVFVRSHYANGRYTPLFSHYTDAPSTCPWYQGSNLTPDDARAAQYQGHQETALHRWMCQTIGDLVRADSRCSLVTVETYRRPAIEQRGRFPDVYAEIDGLGRFAIEVQLAKPFAMEIAARQLHYEAEDVSLVWVFRELPSELPQGFRDVITLHRGNAFVFDDEAFSQSVDQKCLMLNTYLEGENGGFLKPKLVRLDDLDRSSKRAVFLQDRRTKKLLEFCRFGRVKWWTAFNDAPPVKFSYPFSEVCFIPAWDSIKKLVPELVPWKKESWSQGYRGDRKFAEFAAILFSIARSSASSIERVYVTRFSGAGALLAMLNAKLTSTQFMPYADLVETMIAATPKRDLLGKQSLQKILLKAKSEAVQADASHPVWLGSKRLFPEIFDGLIRAELDDIGKLPLWAGGSWQGQD